MSFFKRIVKKKYFWYLLVVLFILGLSFFWYQRGFEVGKKAGFQAAYTKLEEDDELPTLTVDSKHGILYEIDEERIVILDSDREMDFYLADEVEIFREIEISPSEFDDIEREYISTRRELEDAQRRDKPTEQLEEDYKRLKEEYERYLDIAQDGFEEITVEELSEGDLISLKLKDERVEKIKLLEY